MPAEKRMRVLHTSLLPSYHCVEQEAIFAVVPTCFAPGIECKDAPGLLRSIDANIGRSLSFHAENKLACLRSEWRQNQCQAFVVSLSASRINLFVIHSFCTTDTHLEKVWHCCGHDLISEHKAYRRSARLYPRARSCSQHLVYLRLCKIVPLQIGCRLHCIDILDTVTNHWRKSAKLHYDIL